MKVKALTLARVSQGWVTRVHNWVQAACMTAMELRSSGSVVWPRSDGFGLRRCFLAVWVALSMRVTSFANSSLVFAGELILILADCMGYRSHF